MFVIGILLGTIVGYQKLFNTCDDTDIEEWRPPKLLTEKDTIIVDMLLSEHKSVSFVFSDPDLPDNELIYASSGFCNFTGYDKHEIINRNCRFLQGPKTAKKDIDYIRDCIKKKKEASVSLLNYKKDGEPFNNQFFLCPLFRKDNGRLAYFLGVQVETDNLGPGQAHMNNGWVYRL